jgi:hypothetical protein
MESMTATTGRWRKDPRTGRPLWRQPLDQIQVARMTAVLLTRVDPARNMRRRRASKLICVNAQMDATFKKIFP